MLMNTILPFGTLIPAAATPTISVAAPASAAAQHPVQVDVVDAQSLKAAAGTDEKARTPIAATVIGSLTGAFVGMQVGNQLMGPIAGFVLAYMGSKYGSTMAAEIGTKKAALVAGATVLGGLAAYGVMGPTGLAFGAPAAFCLAEMMARSGG